MPISFSGPNPDQRAEINQLPAVVRVALTGTIKQVLQTIDHLSQEEMQAYAKWLLISLNNAFDDTQGPLKL
jgi:hypothetical protein